MNVRNAWGFFSSGPEISAFAPGARAFSAGSNPGSNYALPSIVATFSCVRAGALASLIASMMMLSSCASATIIPLQGSVADLSALTGEWLGTYSSPDVAREGTVWFKLVEGEDHAHGDVRMTPRGTRSPYMPHLPADQMRSPTQFLGVRFVRVSRTEVSGALDQYWDPDAGCLATTIFRGQLYRDRLEGTFETRLATGVVAQGRWRADRKVYR
jgi:hypothetical protein